MTEKEQHLGFNAAMAKFQGEYEPPKKDKKVDYRTKKGDHIKYDYADLNSLQNAIRETASKHGLSWNADFDYKETEINVYGKTQKALLIIANVCINHSSGTEKHFKGIPLYAAATDPQSMGSTRTYAERYALSSAFGIASDEDDDGKLANDAHEQIQMDNNKKNEDNSKKIQDEIQKHQAYLLDSGVDLQKITQYILKQEKTDNLNDVDPIRVMGHYQSLATKRRTDQSVEKKKKEEVEAKQTKLDGPQWGVSSKYE